MLYLKTFRVWNYQINRWTDGFVHYSLPKNDTIRESTNLEILGRVLISKTKTAYLGHHSPDFQKWLKQVKMREVSTQSPEYQSWLMLKHL